ncbi:hypothetical protein BC829DRAFT_409037 [Chytridium lagenaria]|nr:hypothetical protein BC829DRAFT_409037 [Chytridium lagenaria]
MDSLREEQELRLGPNLHIHIFHHHLTSSVYAVHWKTMFDESKTVVGFGGYKEILVRRVKALKSVKKGVSIDDEIWKEFGVMVRENVFKNSAHLFPVLSVSLFNVCATTKLDEDEYHCDWDNQQVATDFFQVLVHFVTSDETVVNETMNLTGVEESFGLFRLLNDSVYSGFPMTTSLIYHSLLQLIHYTRVDFPTFLPRPIPFSTIPSNTSHHLIGRWEGYACGAFTMCVPSKKPMKTVIDFSVDAVGKVGGRIFLSDAVIVVTVGEGIVTIDEVGNGYRRWYGMHVTEFGLVGRTSLGIYGSIPIVLGKVM